MTVQNRVFLIKLPHFSPVLQKLMNQRTSLFDAHVAANARMVDFGGWDMPVNYGSQIQEHQAVRQAAGVFDVSHMTIVDVYGDRARAYLRKLLANDVDKLKTNGKALYSAMLTPEGKVIDDLIVYRTDPGYRVIVNCSTRDKDLRWMQQVAVEFEVHVEFRGALSMLAVQGPQAIAITASVVTADQAELIQQLSPFQGLPIGDWFIGRTGYTGEDGLEIMLPHQEAVALWQQLLAAGVQPCGLGARDTLRLEAGMNLYGHEMDENTSPLIANMAWTIAWQPSERHFIGRAALEAERDAGIQQQLTGLIFTGKGILRAGQKLRCAQGTGVITSGSFSPSLNCSIAIARLPLDAQQIEVDIRGQWQPVQAVSLPFVKQGQILHTPV